MGGNQSDISNIGTAKGEGYRIINVRPNSPLDQIVIPFFDFIIDAIPSKQPQRTAKQILGKLTDEQPAKERKVRKLEQIIAQSQNSPITIRVVSTKYRNVRNIEFTPNSKWNGSKDLDGLELRIQRYDEAFDTYFPFADIKMNSPAKKAGILEGEFLIGCKEFKYESINDLLENLYDRFFDKEVQDKTIHLAIYNIVSDELRVVPVLLSRSWGEKGLLGCQFLQGHLNKFPKNLQEVRGEVLIRKKQSEEEQKVKNQLIECNGASVQLIQSLRNKKKKKNNFKHLRNVLQIQRAKPVKQVIRSQQNEESEPMKQPMSKQNMSKQNMSKQNMNIQNMNINTEERFVLLQNRVAQLQNALIGVKEYLDTLANESEQDEIG